MVFAIILLYLIHIVNFFYYQEKYLVIFYIKLLFLYYEYAYLL